jgi:hypothetical protein
LSSTPVHWMPGASLTFTGGETLDISTGEVGMGRSWTASIPLRLFGRLELDASVAYQSLDAKHSSVSSKRLLTERDAQINAIWHLSNRLYALAQYQRFHLREAAASTDGVDEESSAHLASFLVSYQANWQTRYFIGLRDSAAGAEIFAKLSYAFTR